METYKIIHKRTSDSGKTITADKLEYGEIAVNYGDGGERLSFKNSSNDIVEIYPMSKDFEEVTSIALNELNNRVDEISGSTSSQSYYIAGHTLFM